MKQWKFPIVFFSAFLLTFQLYASTRGLSVDIRDRSGKQVGMYAKSHALLIGVSDYTAGWPDLQTIPAELSKVELILKKQGFNVVKVIDPDSNKLQKTFKNFIDKYGYNENDRLLFFFSGHGYSRKNGKKGYLVPTDAPNPEKDKKGFLRKALNMSQIITWSRQMESKHALFLFDSCFSGAIFKTKALPKAPPHINTFTSSPVRQYITAGSAGEEVPASSVFTPSFIRALEGEADLNRDGYVTGTEMGMFLNEKVMGYNSQQTPQYGKIKDPDLDRGDFVFVVNKTAHSGPTKKRQSLPLQKNDDEEEFWMEIRRSQSIQDFQDYMDAFPNGRFSKLARIKIKRIKEKNFTADDWYKKAKKTKDRELKREYFRKAERIYLKNLESNPKSSKSLFGLGNVYKRTGQEEKSIYYYTKDIEFNNHYWAYPNRGYVYLVLDKFEKSVDDFTVALKKQKDAWFYNNRGVAFGNLGRTKDAANDFDDYMKVVGIAKGAYELGLVFRSGRLIRKDYKKARKWFLLASENGHANANNQLGLLFESGKGVKRSYGQAVKYYKIGAKRGDQFAPFNIGRIYRDGKGVKKDIDEAMVWFEMASQRGHPTAIEDFRKLRKSVVEDNEKWKYAADFRLVYRVNYSGDIECASYNAHDCLWEKLKNQINYGKLNPLACGEHSLKEWGTTGYSDPKHWCSVLLKREKSKP